MYHYPMEDLDLVRETLASLDMTGWGIAPVPPGAGGEAAAFRCAAVTYRSYGLPRGADPLLGGAYDEQALHDAIAGAREAGFAELEKLDKVLAAAGIRYWSVPGGQDPDTLIGSFSQKRAAVTCGLGWIGRSSLFVTPLYGPRVRLFTVLLDIEPPEGALLIPGGCGECTECADACPSGYLTGEAWRPKGERRDLIDAFACSAEMERLGRKIGRKHSCGRCLLACPLGVSARGG